MNLLPEKKLSLMYGVFFVGLMISSIFYVGICRADETGKAFAENQLEIQETSVDRTKLWAAIDEAEAKIEESYTSKTWESLQGSLILAIDIDDDELATQEEIDVVAADLNKSIADLAEPPQNNTFSDLLQNATASLFNVFVNVFKRLFMIGI